VEGSDYRIEWSSIILQNNLTKQYNLYINNISAVSMDRFGTANETSNIELSSDSDQYMIPWAQGSDAVQQYVNFTFQANNLIQRTTRVTTVKQILAAIGGFYKTTFAFFAVAVTAYSKYRYKRVVANKLYDTNPDPDSSKNTSKDKKPATKKKTADQSKPGPKKTVDSTTSKKKGADNNKPLLSSDLSMQPYNTDEAAIKADLEGDVEGNIEDAASGEIEEAEGLFSSMGDGLSGIDFSDFLSESWVGQLLGCVKCGKKKGPKSHSQKVAQAAQKALEDMDMVEVVKKLQEIDKLKAILLNDDQKKLFDMTSKMPLPVTEEDDDDVDNAKGQKNTEAKQVEEYVALYKSYTSITKDKETRNANRGLIGLLDKKKVKFLEEIRGLLGPIDDEGELRRLIEKKMLKQKKQK
jgi:hypothetical protein